MLNYLINNLYIIPICRLMFMLLYVLGGEDIIWFRKKHYAIDDKAGETLVKELNKFTRLRDYKVLGRTTLRFGETEYTYDAIMLTYYGTIVFTAAPQGGEIYGDTSDDSWVMIYEGKRRPFRNPMLNMNGSEKFFREMYRAENVKFGKTDMFVVFPNKDASVAVTSKNGNVCKVDRMSGILEKKYFADNGADIDAMEAAIKKYTV